MTDKANRTVTRRRVIAGSAIALGGLALSGGQGTAQEKSPKAGAITRARAIHQEENFNVTAQRVYEILLDSKQFTAFSGGRAAEIQSEVGGAFSVFRWPHCGAKPGVGAESADRPGMACGHVAGRHLFNCQV